MFASPTIIKPINDWSKTGDHVVICVAVDIGGSGLRIRISNASDQSQFIDLGHIRAQGTKEAISVFTSLGETLHEYVPNFETASAVLAVAGPITNGRVILTNWSGEVESRTLVADELPLILFPRGKTVFLNDLEAGAYGIIEAEITNVLDSHFEQMWAFSSPKGKIVSDTRTAVLAMGSGLGVALIVKSPLLQEPLVVPTELGHMQIPVVCKNHPDAKDEYELIQHVSNHYHGGKQTPEYEDIASGRGLCIAYQYFKLKNENKRIPAEQLSAKDIAEAAKTGEKSARQALEWHYRIFFRAAKSIATSLTCDSIVLALDNQVTNNWFVNAIADILHDEFYNFIRPDWVKDVRVYTQIESLNFNILGTQYMAQKIALH